MTSEGTRDDDEDERRDRDRDGRRGRDSSRGWCETLRRSLSRSARNHGRDEGRSQDQGRDRDRSGNREGGRRRDLGLEAPMLLEARDARTFSPPLRGRSATRSSSPDASRRRSRAARTPPATPDSPSSPTSVISISPAAKGAESSLLMLSRDGSQATSPLLITASQASPASLEARLALDLLAPPRLIRVRSPSLVCSPSRPPGFDGTSTPASPVSFTTFVTPMSLPMAQRTPLFGSDSTLVCMPTSSPHRQASAAAGMEKLFVDRERAILGTPSMSSPPGPQVNRRKTLAGMAITRAYGFSLRRASARIKAKRKAAPVAKKAEALVCQSLGIIRGGQVVTEQALAEFARRFEGQVSLQVIEALCALFKLEGPEASIDEALIASGGAGALDLEESADTANV